MSLLNLIKIKTRPFRMLFNRVYRESIIFPRLKDDTIRAVIRHEAHRLEKAYYNGVYLSKKNVYKEKAKNILLLIDILTCRGKNVDLADLNWAKNIALNADSLDQSFINTRANKIKNSIFSNGEQSVIDKVQFIFSNRRSVRVWADEQLEEIERKDQAERLIKLAVNMPSSGNRQAVRFIVFNTEEQRKLLHGVKESHCYNAPLVICILVDESLYGSYGAFAKTEECIFIDAAAAASAILIGAELEGMSTCWNHFGKDLISSRKSNIKKFEKIKKTYSLPESIRPIALIAIGVEAFQPPTPERMPLESYIYND